MTLDRATLSPGWYTGEHFCLEPEAGIICFVMNCQNCKASGYVIGSLVECPLCLNSIHIEHALGIRNDWRLEMESGTFNPWADDKNDEMLRARFPKEASRFDMLRVIYEGEGHFKAGWYFGPCRSIPLRKRPASGPA